jgi:hypothetical protein
MTYPSGKIKRKGLIVMGDLPKWKKKKRNSLIIMDDL